MKKPTLQEVLDAISFGTPGPDGGIEAHLVTPGFRWTISAVPTTDGKLAVRMSGKHTPQRLRGASHTRVVVDEMTDYLGEIPVMESMEGREIYTFPCGCRAFDKGGETKVHQCSTHEALQKSSSIKYPRLSDINYTTA